MNILMFGWDFSTKFSSGLGTACLGLTKSLVDLGIKIKYIYPSRDEMHLSSTISGNGIPFPDLPVLNKQIEHFEYTKIAGDFTPYSTYQYDDITSRTIGQEVPTNFQEFLQSLESYSQLCLKEIKNNNFDLIHVHDWPGFPAAFAAKKTFKKPLLVHVHSTAIDRQENAHNNQIFNIEKKGFELADIIITVSEVSRNVLVKEYGIAPKKIKVVYPGVAPLNLPSNLSPESPFYHKKIIGFLGRFAHQKKPSHFVNIASKLLEKSADFGFIMAGEGSYKKGVINLVAKMGISKHFYFPGHLENENLGHFFKTIDLLLVPSYAEPFGLVALEAASANVPVIICREAGVNEVLPGNIEIDNGESQMAADEVEKLFNTPHLIRNAVNLNLNASKLLSWEASAKKVIDVYKHILKHKV